MAVTIDRQLCCPVLIVSPFGGSSIEDVSKSQPSGITSLQLDYDLGVDVNVVASVAKSLGIFDRPLQEKLHSILTKLYSVFKDRDATLVEINPLVINANQDFVCLDAKINIDDAALLRQLEVSTIQAANTLNSAQTKVRNFGLTYIELDGDIGKIVNGAGLAMATNDAVAYFGGKSANFLDAGGKATVEMMTNAFRLVLEDE